MSVVLAVAQVAAALLLVVPLVLAVLSALRRANRKIDRILREECEPEPSAPEAGSADREVRPATGPSARSAGNSRTW